MRAGAFGEPSAARCSAVAPPMTAACCRASFCSGSRASSRAASSACKVAGMAPWRAQLVLVAVVDQQALGTGHRHQLAQVEGVPPGPLDEEVGGLGGEGLVAREPAGQARRRRVG